MAPIAPGARLALPGAAPYCGTPEALRARMLLAGVSEMPLAPLTFIGWPWLGIWPWSSTAPPGAKASMRLMNPRRSVLGGVATIGRRNFHRAMAGLLELGRKNGARSVVGAIGVRPGRGNHRRARLQAPGEANDAGARVE